MLKRHDKFTLELRVELSCVLPSLIPAKVLCDVCNDLLCFRQLESLKTAV